MESPYRIELISWSDGKTVKHLAGFVVEENDETLTFASTRGSEKFLDMHEIPQKTVLTRKRLKPGNS